MKLGKKLEVTNIKERMRFLLNDQTACNEDGLKIWFNGAGFVTETFTQGCEYLLPDNKLWNEDWYYPAKTYTINGVELIDERVTDSEECERVYLSAPSLESMYTLDTFSDIDYYHEMIARSLLHNTKEAAIAHAKAMIKVQELG